MYAAQLKLCTLRCDSTVQKEMSSAIYQIDQIVLGLVRLFLFVFKRGLKNDVFNLLIQPLDFIHACDSLFQLTYGALTAVQCNLI